MGKALAAEGEKTKKALQEAELEKKALAAELEKKALAAEAETARMLQERQALMKNISAQLHAVLSTVDHNKTEDGGKLESAASLNSTLEASPRPLKRQEDGGYPRNVVAETPEKRRRGGVSAGQEDGSGCFGRVE